MNLGWLVILGTHLTLLLYCQRIDLTIGTHAFKIFLEFLIFQEFQVIYLFFQIFGNIKVV